MTIFQALITSRSEESTEQLQDRFNEQGYLYFKQAINPQRCERLMHDMLHCLQPHIVFDQQRQLPQLMGEPFFETDPIWDQVYPRIQSLPSFHNFFHQN